MLKNTFKYILKKTEKAHKRIHVDNRILKKIKPFAINRPLELLREDKICLIHCHCCVIHVKQITSETQKNVTLNNICKKLNKLKTCYSYVLCNSTFLL